MDNNANIKMKIVQTADDESDKAELFTKGEFRSHGGAYFIDYDESEATGFNGSHVQLKIEGSTVTMTRTGTAFSCLIFERGERHLCHYGTEYGDCMIGITTVNLDSSIDDDGGRMYVKYTIDVNAGLMLTNEITISVKLQSKKIKET